jgi:type IV pilus assembly protein PilY1
LPVSVNAQGTYLNQVFIGMFRPDESPRWYGNLKQYQFRADAVDGKVVALRLVDKTNNINAISPASGFVNPCAQSFWSTADTYWPSGYLGSCLDSAIGTDTRSNSPDGEIVEKGGAAQRLRAVSGASGALARTVKTCSGCADNSALADFGTGTASVEALGVADATEQSALINWARGQNLANELSLGTTVMRPSVHGDVVHSRPLAIDYGGSIGVVVFYGGNDGMLRAINGKQADTDGNELWSFVAPEHYGKLKRLRSNSPNISFPPPPTGTTPKDYFFDGPIGVYDGGSSKWIYATMRRGGSAVYAFDVSTPTAPTLKWKRDATLLTNIGQTWSEPKVVKVAGYVGAVSGVAEPLIIMGGGYDLCEDLDVVPNMTCTTPKGNQVYVLDADDGTLLATLSTDRSVAADVTVVDSDFDGKVDVAYAADTGGNLYRINIGTLAPGSWTITKLATLGCTSSAACSRKFLNAPAVVPDSDFNAILVGSGNRERPLLTNQAVNVDNAFFMIKDDHSATPAVITTTDLVSIDPNLALNDSQKTALASSKGWYLAFGTPDGNLDLDHDKEQVVTSAVVVAGVAYFSTNQPITPTACGANLGKARGYGVKYLDASTPGNVSRSSEFVGGGLPPSPVAGVVSISLTNADNTTVTKPDGTPATVSVPFVIGAGGGGLATSPPIADPHNCGASGVDSCLPADPHNCGISGLDSCLINVPISPVRHRTYWYIQQ